MAEKGLDLGKGRCFPKHKQVKADGMSGRGWGDKLVDMAFGSRMLCFLFALRELGENQ